LSTNRIALRQRETIETANFPDTESLSGNKAFDALKFWGGQDFGQLPYCYMRPSAKLAVKPTNWRLRSNLNCGPWEPQSQPHGSVSVLKLLTARSLTVGVAADRAAEAELV
jgi:hypothetical protein